MTATTRRYVSLAALAALLSACGGGHDADQNAGASQAPPSAGTLQAAADIAAPERLAPSAAASGCSGGHFTTSTGTGALGRQTFFSALGSYIAGCTNPSSASGPQPVAGTASASSNAVADGDVNDPAAPYAANDQPAQAQAIPNPGIANGFASKAGSGLAGSRFANSADEFDTYRAVLAQGQTVALEMGSWLASSPGAVDLDLYLYDTNLNLVASSEGVGKSESLTAPAAGTYLVVVGAFSGASTYTLSVGTRAGNLSAQAGHWNRQADFVAGQAIASLRTDIGQDMRGQQATLASRHAILAGTAETALLIDLRSGADAGLARAAAVATDRWSGRTLSPVEAARADTLRRLKALAVEPSMAAVAPNYRMQHFATANDEYYPLQWHYNAIRLPSAWDITRGSRSGRPVIVAVIDTGVVLTHPDLQGRLVAGYDFISDPAIAVDGNGIDADPNDPGDQGAGGGSTWHGTHVAGTVAAATNNSTGVAGVAGDARVMPVRVLGKGGGTTFDILNGLRYAAGLSNASGTVPSQAADVINMSLGGGGFVQQMQDAVTEARARGVIVIAAAGNSATSEPSYPAAYSGVVSVSAVDTANALAPYSNFGSTIDVAAPGGDTSADRNADGYADGVLSTVMLESSGSAQPGFSFMQGTSMAAPHVAGVAALMRAVNADITPAQVDSLLASGSIVDDLGTAGRDNQFGYGLINAYKAVIEARELAGTPTTGAVIAAVPSRVDFGTATSTSTLRLENQGSGSITVSSISDDASWLSISAGSAVNGGLQYTLTASRSGLGAGAYSATISVGSSAGSLTVPVTLEVAGATTTGNAGHLYFLLLDPDSGENLHQVEADASRGSYAFSFGSVEARDYFLIAGSDLDNDGFICGDGETCGLWPASDLPQLLSVGDSAQTGLRLSVAPTSTLKSSAAGGERFRGYPLRPR